MALPSIYGQFLHVPEPSYLSRGFRSVPETKTSSITTMHPNYITSNRELGEDELAAILEELQPKSNTPLPFSQKYQSLHSVAWYPYSITPALSSVASDSDSSDLSCPSTASLSPSEAPTSFYKRWGAQRGKRSAQRTTTQRKSALLKLSPELLARVAEDLRPSNGSDTPDSHIADLLSASLSCRELYSACQKVLYHDITFTPGDLEIFKKHILSKKGTKLELLLRSFRKNKALGQHVRYIHCSGNHNNDPVELSQGSECALTDLLNQCSNIESITGLPLPCIDNQSELHRTISAQENLRQLQCIGRSRLLPSQHDSPASPFSNLQTLTIMNPGFTTSSESLRFSMLIRRLPSLKYLVLSGFPRLFSDSHFRMLPLHKLHALRLENMAGLTDDGLDATFSGLKGQSSLLDITLIESGISSMSALGAILNNCNRLRRLTILASSMAAPQAISKRDLLHSRSLRQIHWQVQGPDSNEDAYQLLAYSIAANLMPSLLTVRAPFDQEGTIQAVCRPLAPPEMNSRVQPSGNQIPQSSTSMSMAYSRRAAMARAAKALAPFRRRWIDAIGGEWDIIQNLGEGRFFSEENFDANCDSLGYIRIAVQDEDGRVVTMTDRPKFLGRVQPQSNVHQAAIPDYVLFGDGDNDAAVCSIDEWMRRRLL